MSVIINPGSRIAEAADDEGWTNTYAAALAIAREWHGHMADDGFGADIDLIEPDDMAGRDGRWTFGFRHRVTGVTVELETHGIAPLDAYTDKRIFAPRQYWNGSSSSNPALEHWAAPGFVQTYRPGGAA